MNVKAVYICKKEVQFTLNIFYEGERVWMTDDNLDEGRGSYPVYHDEHGGYALFGEAVKYLQPHLRKIRIPKYPREYYMAQTTTKKIKDQIRMMKLIEKYAPK